MKPSAVILMAAAVLALVIGPRAHAAPPSPTDIARGRVQAFIAAYEASSVGPATGADEEMTDEQSGRLRRAFAKAVGPFFEGNPDDILLHAGGMNVGSSVPVHAVAHELILGSETLPDGHIQVSTRFKDLTYLGRRPRGSRNDAYYDYRLVLRSGAWLIDHVDRYRYGPSETLDTPYTRPPIAETALGPRDDVTRLRHLFGPATKTTLLGRITLAKGRVAVAGPEDLNFEVHALARTVPPGSYDVVVAHRDNGTSAMKLVVTPGAIVATYVAAGRLQSEVATAAILDFDALRAANARQREQVESTTFVVERHGHGRPRGERHGVLTIPGTTTPVLAYAPSGYGDGSYPVYWGLAADGSPIELLIDFRTVK